ncbi:hypothetical protein B0H15DRAFT_736225, partial [Mycena belliarum]
TTSVIRTPPPSASRLCPTPLLFVSAKAWDPDSHTGLDVLTATLSMKGFTCILSDLALPAPLPRDSAELMHHFVADLKGQLRHTVAFPPVIFARASASLVAQTYIGSNPATAMMLMGAIPPTNSDVPKALLPTPLEEFNFEPKFPIALLATALQMERLRRTNRLAQDPMVDLVTTEDLESQDALLKIEGWLDDLGI